MQMLLTMSFNEHQIDYRRLPEADRRRRFELSQAVVLTSFSSTNIINTLGVQSAVALLIDMASMRTRANSPGSLSFEEEGDFMQLR